MAARKQRDVPHGNSSGRPCDGCLSGSLSDLNRQAAAGTLFLTIDLPAFYKSRRKVVWPGCGPTIDDTLRKKCAGFDFGSIGGEPAKNFASINPDKLLVRTF